MKKTTLMFLILASYLFLFTASSIAQPTISANPQDQSVLEGNSAVFAIIATGTGTLSYQWYKNDVAISGEVSSIYTILTTVLADDASVFYCTVTDDIGPTQSTSATLSITAGISPSITVQPQDQAVFGGQTAIFNVTADGTAPLQYQWKKNNVDISGATASTYTTAATILADHQSTFSCTVTNSFGSVASSNATLLVTDASNRISSNLQLLYEFEEQGGETITDVSGTGTAENITIQTPEDLAWTPNGLETFGGATTRRGTKGSKIIDAVQSTNEITIEAWFKPEFMSQQSRRIFTFSVSGNFRNFSLVQNNSSYEVLMRTSNSDDNGTPGFSSSPGTASDELVHFVYTKEASGLAKIYINGSLDTSMTNAGDINNWSTSHWLAIGSEPLGGLEWRGVHYLAAVYNRALTSFEVNHNFNIATDFDEAPFFTINPEDKFILEGESIFLDSYAVSVLPISYVWKRNGSNIAGENDRTLNLANLGVLDNGAVFTCVATTSSGSATSSSATLFVTGAEGRVNQGSQVIYNFREGSGSAVNDVSGVGSPLNLTIHSNEAVEWQNEGLKINSSPSIVTSGSATKISSALKSSNEISIEAWISSSDVNQTSPSRILTVSADQDNRNFSLGQNGDSFEVNLRTTSTDANGSPSINSSPGTVSSEGFDHVVFTRADDGTAKFYINGTERISTTVGGDFSNWNDFYFLSLGNENGTDQHWKGLINFIAVFNRDITSSEVLRNYTFGAYGVVAKPSNLSLTSNEVGIISVSWNDNSSNEEGFILERGSGDPIVYSQIADLPTDSTTYTDENIVDNTNYTYRVKSYYSLGESDYSDSLTVLSLITGIETPTNLSATSDIDGYPILSWDDNSTTESNFLIERRASASGATFSIIDTVDENITSYIDFGVTANSSYIYKVMAFNKDTVSAYSGEKFVEVGIITDVDDISKIPSDFSLSQNYPNPFNPSTTIKFGLPQNSNVSILLFNLLGQEVMKLAEKDYSAGIHSLELSANNLTSGIYIYSITALGVDGKNFSQTKKMILLK